MDAEVVAAQLERIVNTPHLIEPNHRLIIHYIQKLGAASALDAARCLKNYIVQRLIPEGSIEWTEKAIVSYLSVYTAQHFVGSASIVQGLGQELDIFCETMECGLSPIAAQSAHVLV